MHDLITVMMNEPVPCNFPRQLHLAFEQRCPPVHAIRWKSHVPCKPWPKLGTMNDVARRIGGSIIDDGEFYAVCGQMAQTVPEVWLFVPGSYDCNDFHAQ